MELIKELADIVRGQRDRPDTTCVAFSDLPSIDQRITARLLLLSGIPNSSPSQEETLPWTLHFECLLLALLLWRSPWGQGPGTWACPLAISPWDPGILRQSGSPGPRAGLAQASVSRLLPQVLTGPSVCLPFSQTIDHRAIVHTACEWSSATWL